MFENSETVHPTKCKSLLYRLSLLESIFLPLIEEVSLCTAKIHYLWTTISLQNESQNDLIAIHIQ